MVRSLRVAVLALLAAWRRTWLSALRYRPERRYMRGGGGIPRS